VLIENRTTLTKNTRPVVNNVLHRERLFKLFDESKPVIFLTSPGGAGKTTLASSYVDSRRLPCVWYRVDSRDADASTFFHYFTQAVQPYLTEKKSLPKLTPEYLPNIVLFARNYFESIYRQLPMNTLMAFDNYQEVTEDSVFHTLLICALEVMPEGFKAMFISRGKLPKEFMRLLANRVVEVIDWEAVRMNREEVRTFIKTVKLSDELSDHELEKLYVKIEGWPAGIILFLEGAKLDGFNLGTDGVETPSAIFNYFALEVLQNMDVQTKSFLLQTAYLPRMTAEMAKSLTTNYQAANILTLLNETNCFTEKHAGLVSVYQYHQLFREFLLVQSQEYFSKPEIIELQTKSAALLVAAGDIDEAVNLYFSAQAYESIAALIHDVAMPLMQQGRFQGLLGWLQQLPVNLVESDPWLLFCLGTCQITSAPQESATLLSKSFRMFNAANHPEGTYLAWASAVEAIIFCYGDYKALDPWLAELGNITEKYGPPPMGEIEARVITLVLNAFEFRSPGRTRIESHWIERAHEIIENFSGNENLLDVDLKINLIFTVLYHYQYMVDKAKSTPLLKRLQGFLENNNLPPLARSRIQLAHVLQGNFLCDPELCLSSTLAGFKLSEEIGIHVFDYLYICNLVWISVGVQDFSTAEKYLKKMENMLEQARPWEVGYYYGLRTYLLLEKKQIPEALEYANISYSGLDKTDIFLGHYFYTGIHAYVMFEAGRLETANQTLGRLKEVADESHYPNMMFGYLLTASYFSLKKKEEELGLELLRQAMRLGREHAFYHHLIWRQKVMADLCYRALEANIEIDYVQKLIKQRNLLSENSPISLENWPWLVKLYTLGRFNIVIDGEVLSLGSKGHKKPMELLKAIIALGGRGISESLLTDSLWPDVEGDSGTNSFTTTLHRLRKLIGSQTVVCKQGKVSLDERVCWVDVWAFERELNRLKHALKQQEISKIIRSADLLMHYYQAPFLAKEENSSYLLPLRERLHSRFIRALLDLADFFLSKAQLEQAIIFYEKSIELEPLVEKAYQGLMQCYLAQQQAAEGVMIYERCNQQLKENLNIKPSNKTLVLLKELKAL